MTNVLTTGPKTLKEQEKIMEYDARTGETKEVDMEELRQKAISINKKSANYQINSLCRTTDEHIIGIIKAGNLTSTQVVRISQNIIDIIRENR